MSLALCVDQIVGLKEDPAKRRLEVRTDRSGVLWIDLSAAVPVNVELIRTAQAEREFVVLRFETETRRVTMAVPPVQDCIAYLGDRKAADRLVEVAALKRPTGLFLDKEHPRFEELYALLSQAHMAEREGAQAVLAVLPGANRVEDVVVIPPPKP